MSKRKIETMADELKQTIDFIRGYLIYSKGENEVLAIKADHISSIKYRKDETGATTIDMSIGEESVNLKQDASVKETVSIIAHNGVKLDFSCTKEKFDKIMDGVYSLYNSNDPNSTSVELN